MAKGSTIGKLIPGPIRQVTPIDLLETVVGLNPIGKETMKRISFLIVATIASVVANGNAVSAQNFPSTGIDSFNGAAASDLMVKLPPLPQLPNAQQAASNLIAPDGPIVIAPQSPQAASVPSVLTTPQLFTQPQMLSLPAQQIVQQPAAQQILVSQQTPMLSLPSAVPQNIQSFAPAAQTYFAPEAQQFAPAAQTFVQPQGYVYNEPLFAQNDFGDGSAGAGVERSRSGARRDARNYRRASVFSTAGASALLFDRNNGGDRRFSSNAAGDLLSSNDAENDVLAGVDAFVARRRASGTGWEARYFGLFPENESISIGNNAQNLLPGLNQLGATLSGNGPQATVTGLSASDLFDRADTHVLTRQTEINNAEFNFLKASPARFGAASTEFLFGLRYFQFGETLFHQGLNVTNGDANFVGPNSVDYFSSVENDMYGLQIGTRQDYRFRNRLTLHLGAKGGAFYNDINTRQRVDYNMPDGSTTNPLIAGGANSGQLFDVGAEDDVRSVLGEVDISVSYQVSASSRFRIGYRALAITDIAFASDQIQDDFTDATDLASPNTDDDLTLQGGYAGLEFAY